MKRRGELSSDDVARLMYSVIGLLRAGRLLEDLQVSRGSRVEDIAGAVERHGPGGGWWFCASSAAEEAAAVCATFLWDQLDIRRDGALMNSPWRSEYPGDQPFGVVAAIRYDSTHESTPGRVSTMIARADPIEALRDMHDALISRNLSHLSGCSRIALLDGLIMSEGTVRRLNSVRLHHFSEIPADVQNLLGLTITVESCGQLDGRRWAGDRTLVRRRDSVLIRHRSGDLLCRADERCLPMAASFLVSLMLRHIYRRNCTFVFERESDTFSCWGAVRGKDTRYHTGEHSFLSAASSVLSGLILEDQRNMSICSTMCDYHYI